MANVYKLLSRSRNLTCGRTFTAYFKPSEIINYSTQIVAQAQCKPQKVEFSSEQKNEKNNKNPCLYTLQESYDSYGYFLTESSMICNYDQNVKMLLYSNTNDDVIAELQKSTSVENVFNTIFRNEPNLNHSHVCQAILSLWDMQNVYLNSYLHNLSKGDIHISPEYMLNSYILNLRSHTDFQKILILIEKYVDKLDFNEATFLMHFLKKNGVTYDEPIQRSLINVCNFALDDGQNVNLKAIMHLSNVIQPLNITGYTTTAKAIIQYVYTFLDDCESVEDLENITLTMKNMHLLITPFGIESYKIKVDELLKKTTLGQQQYQLLIKIVNFLNMPQWSNKNSTLVKRLCLIVKNNIKDMNASEIMELNKAFQHHLEPVGLIDEIYQRSKYLLGESENDDRVTAAIDIPYLFYSQLIKMQLVQRNRFELMSLDLLKKCYPSSLSIFYKALRFMKARNKELCDCFWRKVTDAAISLETLETDAVLRLCHKYMYFNLGGKYRYRIFENIMFNYLINKSDSTIFMVPKKAARIAAFILAYGSVSYRNMFDFLNNLINHLEAVSEQLDVYDCLVLSRSLEIYFILNEKTFMNFQQFYNKVDHILGKCSQRHCYNQSVSLDNLNMMTKTHMNRQAGYDTEMFQKLISLYNNVEKGFSSRNIRDAVSNLITSNVMIPTFVDNMLGYSILSKDDIMGETVSRLLYLCFRSGYNPPASNIYQISCELINRDKEKGTALSQLNGGLALSYFDVMPKDLIDYIFSLQFMERIENEIAVCYSRLTYPVRLREALMTLNRTVCLELPQHQIPWFHKKYLEEMKAIAPKLKSALHDNLMSTLITLTKSKAYVERSHYSSYGHHVDFLLHLDNNGNPVSVKLTRGQSNIDKVAILVIKPFEYTMMLKCKDPLNFQPVLNGPYLSKKKQLELMGYRVIEIPHTFWNSMYMTEPGAKSSFLKEKIWPTDRTFEL